MVWEMLYDNTEAMLGSYTLKVRIRRIHSGRDRRCQIGERGCSSH